MTELEQLREILNQNAWSLSEEADEVDGFETVFTEFAGHSRWSVFYSIVTKTPSGKYYRWCYDVGATELQDGDGFIGDLVEVEPYVFCSQRFREVLNG
jgi:hypothetical protein